MRKIITTYGIIAGAIVAGMMFISMFFWENGTLNYDNGELVGYTTMVIALSMVFFGVKSYRDNYLNGVISFGHAFKVGLYITLIACFMYVLAWEICYHTIASDFVDKMSQHHLAELKSEGVSETELKAATEKMEGFVELYKNPIVRMGMTLIEILPVGLILTLISAALLRRKEVLPA